MTRTVPSRLGIIHLLGWTLGCGIVLACYRAIDLQDIPAETRFGVRLIQTLFAMVYGAALGGIGMLCWRRWRGDSSFPSQPGHWLLLFGGLGCLVDGLAAAVSGLVDRWTAVSPFLAPSEWHLHQTLAWSISAVVSLVVAFKCRRAGGWGVMAGAAALLIVSLAAVLVTACVWHNLVARGVWTFVPMSQTFVTYKLPMYLRIFGTPAIIAIMLVALRRDHRRRLERDWIHRAGVLVAIALGSLDVGQNIWALSQW